jgi:FAD/FMN-containing dehydrogenase
MTILQKIFYNTHDLSQHLKTHLPSFYYSSKTSTVIPYDKLNEFLKVPEEKDYYFCDLSKLPPEMKLLENGNLVLKGSVSWEDAKKFLKSQGRNLKTSPTEQLALITAGVATSCTGERCFGFGTMRSQVVSVKYLDYNGEEKVLKRDHAFPSVEGLENYQQEFKKYENFKNAPFPRFEKHTDLMIGTEGQLGVITEVEIETTPDSPVTYVFILLPKWEADFKPHLEIFHKVQSHRGEIYSCELLDSNCMNYLKDDEKLGQNQDVLFLEIQSDSFESIFEEVLCQLEFTTPDDVYEINESKFHHIRASVPRAIFEQNSLMGVVKIGTDVQVKGDDFEKLIEFYRSASKIGVRYCLFGHFGDAHLHFNFMPTKTESPQCLDQISELYAKVLSWEGSPFAEHGIGLLKQKYIQKFHSEIHYKVFKKLKESHDPYLQFFPQGFMNEGR